MTVGPYHMAGGRLLIRDVRAATLMEDVPNMHHAAALYSL